MNQREVRLYTGGHQVLSVGSAKTAKKSEQLSAGLLLFRVRAGVLQVLLVHLGGPFWARKDDGAWFLPKGAVEPGETEFDAALREFTEETGMSAHGPFLELGSVQHKSGKRVMAWAFAGDADPAKVESNLFEMEWPPKSGKLQKFPEIDRADFFTVAAAKQKMHAAEFAFVSRLEKLLAEGGMAET